MGDQQRHIRRQRLDLLRHRPRGVVCIQQPAVRMQQEEQQDHHRRQRQRPDPLQPEPLRQQDDGRAYRDR